MIETIFRVILSISLALPAIGLLMRYRKEREDRRLLLLSVVAGAGALLSLGSLLLWYLDASPAAPLLQGTALLVVLGSVAAFLFRAEKKSPPAAVSISPDRQLLEASSLPMLVLRDGVVAHLTPAAEQLLGLDRGVNGGKALSALCDPESAHQMELLSTRPAGTSIELPLRRPDQSTIQLEVTVTSQTASREQALVLRDIHVRKVTERKLLQAAADSRALLNAIPDMFFRIRPDSICLDFKGAADNPLLVSPVRIVMQPLTTLLLPADQEKLSSAINDALTSGRVTGFTAPMLTDEQERVFEFRVAAAGTDELLVLARDVTELEATRRELEARHEQLGRLIENTLEAMWCIEFHSPLCLDDTEEAQTRHFSRHGFVSFANDICARQYGFTKSDELVGRHVSQFLQESDPDTWEYVASATRSQFTLRNVASHEVDSAGNRKSFLNSFSAEIEGRIVRRIWGYQQDITELELLDQKL